MYLVNIDNGIALFARTFHDQLDALLEVAAILCPGQHRPHVHGIDFATFQSVGDIAFVDSVSKAIDECCLSNTGLADVQRVVLVLTAEHLYCTLQLPVTSDERIVVGKIIIDAGDERLPLVLTPPWGIGAFIIVGAPRIQSFTKIVKIVGFYQLVHEAGRITIDIFQQQVACPTVFEMQQGFREMGNVYRVVTGEVSMAGGILHQLLALLRELRGILLVFRLSLLFLLIDDVKYLFLELSGIRVVTFEGYLKVGN